MKSYEFRIDGTDYEMVLGRCAVSLFYQKPEVDYVVINMTDDEDDTVRVFHPELARWAAGFCPTWDAEDEDWFYANTYQEIDGEFVTFREAMGWNPSTVLKEKPFDWEEERFVNVQTRTMDSDIDDLLGGR